MDRRRLEEAFLLQSCLETIQKYGLWEQQSTIPYDKNEMVEEVTKQFASAFERRLGTIDCSLDRWPDSPDRFKTESGEFRTGRKVEIFTRLRAAKVVFKNKNI